jgi:hypothetical protein
MFEHPPATAAVQKWETLPTETTEPPESIIDNEDPEVRAEHRAKVGAEIKERYLSEETKDKSIEDVLAQHTGSEEEAEAALKKIGVSFDSRGRMRMKRPGAENIPGKYENPEVLKALVVGMYEAKTFDEQWSVVSDVYTYLGLETPDKPPQEEVQKIGGVRNWVLAKVGHLAQAALLAGLLLLPKHTAEGQGGKSVAEATADAVHGSGPTVEQVVEKGAGAPEVAMAYHLQEGENISVVAERLLQEAGVSNPSQEDVGAVARVLSADSDVAVPEWGIGGGHNHQELQPGFEVHVSGGQQVAEYLAGSH